jgi:hypothetical protein
MPPAGSWKCSSRRRRSARGSQWTGDDVARRDAGEHLSATLQALEEAGVSARGEVGAHDPIRAADDALREFPADGSSSPRTATRTRTGSNRAWSRSPARATTCP